MNFQFSFLEEEREEALWQKNNLYEIVERKLNDFQDYCWEYYKKPDNRGFKFTKSIPLILNLNYISDEEMRKCVQECIDECDVSGEIRFKYKFLAGVLTFTYEPEVVWSVPTVENNADFSIPAQKVPRSKPAYTVNPLGECLKQQAASKVPTASNGQSTQYLKAGHPTTAQLRPVQTPSASQMRCEPVCDTRCEPSDISKRVAKKSTIKKSTIPVTTGYMLFKKDYCEKHPELKTNTIPPQQGAILGLKFSQLSEYERDKWHVLAAEQNRKFREEKEFDERVKRTLKLIKEKEKEKEKYWEENFDEYNKRVLELIGEEEKEKEKEKETVPTTKPLQPRPKLNFFEEVDEIQKLSEVERANKHASNVDELQRLLDSAQASKKSSSFTFPASCASVDKTPSGCSFPTSSASVEQNPSTSIATVEKEATSEPVSTTESEFDVEEAMSALKRKIFEP